MKSYFSGVKLELKKVSWIGKQELIGSTMVVLVFAMILGLFLYALDAQILDWIGQNLIYSRS
tara:strand:+ start:77 stop:262 length:186 start_codon:yes stop_codon:yes gene_type:complete